MDIEQALAKIAAQELELAAIKTAQAAAAREFSSVNDSLKSKEAAILSFQDTVAKQTERLNILEATSQDYTKLQESHTVLETQYTGSLHNRLKGHGLDETVFKDRSRVELEAMLIAVDGVPRGTSTPANPTADPATAGFSGNSSSSQSAPMSDVDKADQDYMKRAMNRPIRE